MPSRTREPAAAATPVVNRRKSELPPRITKEFAEEVAQVAAQAAAQAARMEAGIVCSNTDLLHLTGAAGAPGAADDAAAPATTPPTRGSLASLRANSVEAKEAHSVLVTVHGDKAHSSLAAFPTGVRAAPDGVDGSASTASSAAIERRDSEKVLWDERSGSIVDAGLLGSAIEGFLNKDTIAKGRRGAASSVHRATAQLSAWVTAVAIWTPKGAAAAGAAAAPPEAAAADVPGDAVKPAGQDAPAPETPRRRGKMTCDAVCSTLKSLFVK